ncbi:MAG: lamin tail domain-containing protein [Phycisphaerae bacterium]|nr:lamin tail domain-containing protein [Phycisphaerae bacterium]
MHLGRRASGLGILIFLSVCTLVGAQSPGVVINEIHYDPDANTNHVEFVELFNAGTDPVNLGAWSLEDAISYQFPEGTVLDPGAYLVVSQDPGAVLAWSGVTSLGPFEGRLNNTGETVRLSDASGRTVDSVDYQLGFPWPTDTEGRSIELIHPSLDNDLGGSWRASGFRGESGDPIDPTYFVTANSSEWSVRKGTSEPPNTWIETRFGEDESWATGVQAPIGYDRNPDYQLNTTLTDMSGNYVSLYARHTFYIDRSQAIPATLDLRVYVDDGCIVYLNGQEVLRTHVSEGDKSYDDLTGAADHEASWDAFRIARPSDHVRAGLNVLAVHAINQSSGSSDFVLDCELLDPGFTPTEDAAFPSPGFQNFVWSVLAPPQIRQVAHDLEAPRAGEVIRVTAKITDPDQVASASLLYQIVAPGQYIPAYLPLSGSELASQPDQPRKANPAYEDPTHWQAVAMRDDGTHGDVMADDSIYTGTIPAQANRTLVRYRIEAADTTDETVTVPYPDDAALNFACYVYHGIPPYTVKTNGSPGTHTYSPESLSNIPVYTLITRAEDMSRCYAYNGADQISSNAHLGRKQYNWEGAFVYDGQVYDHIGYRLRGANGRYHLRGKRSMKFSFNRGHDLEARDRFGDKYPVAWRKLNVSKLFDNRAVSGSPDQNFGLPEMVNSILFSLAGVPTWQAHWFHFRVVDEPQEAPDQYRGDFWGMFLAMEEYDSQFIKAHHLPDGNLYKLSADIGDPARQIRYQGPESVDDFSDYYNLRNRLSPSRSDQELETLVNYDNFYRYYAMVHAIRHYDSWNFSDKNVAWFFEPQPDLGPYGRLWYLPWDLDLTWGPNWNQGQFEAWWALGDSDGMPQNGMSGSQHGAMRMDFRNTIREFRDLLWNPDTVNSILDELADMIQVMAQADQDRWKNAPSDVGGHRFDMTLAEKVADMKQFAWEGNKTWSSGGSSGSVGPGGQTAVLDRIAGHEGDDTSLPWTPTIQYIGTPDFPMDALVFQCSAFQDPQGSQTFGAMQWRVAEVSNLNRVDYAPRSRAYEIDPVWQSEELTVFQEVMAMGPEGLQPGRLYRARVRMKDNTGRWGHWSAPVEFVAGWPVKHEALQGLRVTEIMYHGTDLTDGGAEAEFIELYNAGQVPIDLFGLAFAQGIEYQFGQVTLAPGDYLVLTRDQVTFETQYGQGMPVLGEYSSSLSNQGERLVLQDNLGITVFELDYRDDWYPVTDGQGHSLVLVDPMVWHLDWSDPALWLPSQAIGGSPGQRE